MQTTTSSASGPCRLTKFDWLWMFNLFGTAIGAGVLFLPINIGAAGIWPIVLMCLLVGPMTYLAHRGLARFILSSPRQDSDITDVAEEHFGSGMGTAITALYFFAIYPILLIYGVSITNTVDSFLVHQLGLASPPRLLLSGLCCGAYILIILAGEQFVLAFNEKLAYPLCAVLLGLSLYLMPFWRPDQVRFVPDAGTFLKTLWFALPIIVFSFNHSPAISSFALSQRRHYADGEAERHVNATLLLTTACLTGFVMLFVFSCVLSLSVEDMRQARLQNVNILSYMANRFADPLISYCGPVVAFLAISTSFFGHYMGAREGLNGLVLKLSPRQGQPRDSRRRRHAITLFFFVTLWAVAYANPSVLGVIERCSGPVIAAILFLMPMYAVARVPAMRRYAGAGSNVFVTVMGCVTIAALLGGMLFQ
ncbi:MAG: aromatic amino acid transport family protein [Desulfovibrionaceae bacterium]|nr:aromatic amino acid transport family protein [Desulfovibrionaceae bacterium]